MMWGVPERGRPIASDGTPGEPAGGAIRPPLPGAWPGARVTP